MNIIEQNLFTINEIDEAINLITPPNMSIAQSIRYKRGIKDIPTDKVLFKANSFLVQHISSSYFTFYLYYLALCNEDATILSIDNGTICVSKDIDKGVIPKNLSNDELDLLLYPFPVSSWLLLNGIKNPKFKEAMDRWEVCRKEIIGDKYYIQLLPANTTFHLDELYRTICAYL